MASTSASSPTPHQRALRQGPRGRRGPCQVRPGQLVCDAEVHATLLGSRRAVDSGDCTVAMAIPTPPSVWRHAPGCACAPDGTRPPAADPDTAGGDRIACDCDVLGLAGHPVQGPLAGAPRPAPLLARPPPGDLCCTDVQPGIGLQAPVLRRSTSAASPRPTAMCAHVARPAHRRPGRRATREGQQRPA
jgi:hypothetical protein